MSDDSDKDNRKPKRKVLAKFFKFILILICVFAVITAAWTVFSLIGRVKAASVLPDSTSVRISVSNPVRLLDGVLAHESLDDISAVPALAQAAAIINMLKDNPFLKYPIVRLAMRGNLEFAMLPFGTEAEMMMAAWDLGFFRRCCVSSPLFPAL